MIQSRDIPVGSVVGINYGGLHDSAVAIVTPDGEPIFSMALERLSRAKQDGRPPNKLLEQMPWEKISKVAVPARLMNDEGHQTTSSILSTRLEVPIPYGKFGHPEEFSEFISTIPCEIEYVCHHLAHTASSFWGSGFEKALCLTYDGGIYSNPWFGGIYAADRTGGISTLDQFNRFYHPDVADLYSFVTALLGFTSNRHEGKITGLAAYGQPSDECRALLQEWFDRNIPIVAHASSWLFNFSSEQPPTPWTFDALIEPYRKAAKNYTREEIAATVQVLAEEHVLGILAEARARGWSGENICLAGGLFANVKINQRIIESGFRNLFVAPPMTDDGTALGAAWHVLSREKRFSPKPLSSVYLGPTYSSKDIRQNLEKEGVVYQTLVRPERHVAELLAGGAVVAVFQGAMELGPRALGNRSILAQASDPDINNSLNARLRRTEFMPFAPVTRVEDAEACYKQIDRVRLAAQFMTVTVDCNDVMRKVCPAVVHVDGTARPQLVSAVSNPFIHGVLTHYKELTQKPALVNTSFNIHEEPIVCSPQDALNGFFESSLDHLYLGDGLLITFSENRDVALRYMQKKIAQPSQRSQTLLAVTQWQSAEMLRLQRQIKELIKSNQDEIAAYRDQVKAHKEMIMEYQKMVLVRAAKLPGRIVNKASRLRDVFVRKLLSLI